MAYENSSSGQSKPDFLTAYLTAHGWTVQDQGTSHIWTHGASTGDPVRLNVDERVGRVRWIFGVLGLGVLLTAVILNFSRAGVAILIAGCFLCRSK